MAHPPPAPGIDARTRLVTLLGYPLSHSLSPMIHNTAFQAQGVPMAYLCLPTPPEDLADVLNGLRAARFVGSNVTIPHKQAVFRLVDELSNRARAVGAVNTIVARPAEGGGRPLLYGDNTDIAGFLAPLAAYLEDLRGAGICVLGAGGSARAVVYAALTELAPSRLWIVARDLSRAEALARDMAPFDARGVVQVCGFEQAEAVRSSRLVVNTTPLGMAPHTEASPWPADDFTAEHFCYDLVYNPIRTRFLVDASARGARVIGGLDMLIEQAAAAYVQWTGQEMPRIVVREALRPFLPA